MLILNYRSEDTYAMVLNYFNNCDIMCVSVEEKKEDFIMTKNMKKVIAVLLAVVLIMALAGTVLADGYDMDFTVADNSGASKSISNIIGAIINMVQVVGTGVAIIMLIVLAIKYISAAPGDKADIKKHAVVYVVGAVVLFAATGILQIIKNFSKNVTAS